MGHNIDISSNSIQALEYCQENIFGNFYCSENELTSLRHGPKIVDGACSYSQNKITSLDGLPQKVDDNIFIEFNHLIENYESLFLLTGNKDILKYKH